MHQANSKVLVNKGGFKKVWEEEVVLKFQKVINITTWYKAIAKIEFEVIVI